MYINLSLHIQFKTTSHTTNSFPPPFPFFLLGKDENDEETKKKRGYEKEFFLEKF